MPKYYIICSIAAILPSLRSGSIMDPSNPPKEDQPEEPRYLDFPHLSGTHDGKSLLNKYSSTITRDHAFPGAQVLQALITSVFEKLTGSGHVIRGRGAGSGEHEKQPTCWHRFCLVGRKSLQVSTSSGRVYRSVLRLVNSMHCEYKIAISAVTRPKLSD